MSNTNLVIGTIGYDTHSGLGHLVKSFYDANVINRVMIVPHKHYPRVPNFYNKADIYYLSDRHRFLNNLDILLLFETGFYWNVVQMAKTKGIKVVLMPMYEYTPHPLPVKPDLMLCPSILDFDYYTSDGLNSTYLPVPIDSNRVNYRLRDKAMVFVHNAGHGGYDWRNGTPELLKAIPMVQNQDIRFIIRMQKGEHRTQKLSEEIWVKQIVEHDKRITMVYGDVDDRELYNEGDVYVAPEKYNGLSLPLQEAWANGLMVMTTNRYPANTWLPYEPLIPVWSIEDHQINRETRSFKRCTISPLDIAKKVDEWACQDISDYSAEGAAYAARTNWQSLLPQYMRVFNDLCTYQPNRS